MSLARHNIITKCDTLSKNTRANLNATGSELCTLIRMNLEDILFYISSYSFSILCCSDSSDSMNEFLWRDKCHNTRKGATGEDLSDIFKDYHLPTGTSLLLE